MTAIRWPITRSAWHLLHALVFLAAVFSTSAHRAYAQEAQRIHYKIACPECQLELTRVMVLDSAPATPLLNGVGGLRRDTRGRMFVTNFDLTQIVVFDAAGKYLRTIGRGGEGPGEFGWRIQGLRVGRADTLFVFRIPAQIEVFSPELVFVRSVKLRGERVDFGLLPNGDFLVKESIRTPASIGHPLHRLSSSGAVLRSFGASEHNITPSEPAPIWSGFAPTPDMRSVWLARPFSYGLKRWNLDGAVLDDVEFYDVPWYPPQPEIGLRPETGALSGRPSYTFAGVDDSGLVYINARSALPQDGTDPSWRVEIYDPLRKEFLLSQEMDGPLRLIDGAGSAYTIRENRAGDVRITIYQLKVVRREMPSG